MESERAWSWQDELVVARAYSAGVLGVDGFVVTVEAEVSLGLPCITVVGQAAGALVEARDRVRAAIGHCGVELPSRKTIVNLAPADMRKDSAGVDLAVACALLSAHGIVAEKVVGETLMWGELALDGQLRSVAGTLVVADRARKAGFRAIAVPCESAAIAGLIPDLTVYPVQSLKQLLDHLRGTRPIEPLRLEDRGFARATDAHEPDMADVRGIALGRSAVEIMVAGGHNLLLHGPPGVGKTMLARRAAGLFPPLDREAALEVTKIHGVANRRIPGLLIDRAPIRAPHHTVTPAGLLGGGSPPRPGEVSLAHRGLLFLDELPEFSRACLEGLREPLEDGEVSIVRASHALRFPARFQLMAAMNPCPCGYLGHPDRACVDSSSSVHRYRQRLSGPFVDRIDLVVPLQPVDADELESRGRGEDSHTMRQRIIAAREIQALRLRGTPWTTNAEIPATEGTIERHCPLTCQARLLLAKLARQRRLSPRAQHRLRRVARTISDLRRPDGRFDLAIEAEHVAEAAHLRRLPDLEEG